jgi:hypothetical protein
MQKWESEYYKDKKTPTIRGIREGISNLLMAKAVNRQLGETLVRPPLPGSENLED